MGSEMCIRDSCERGRCSHFRGTFAGTGAAVHPALTFSVRPKGEDAPWTEVGTVASVADSVPFDLELPLWATGVQLQLFQEELFAVSIHAACVGCEFTCEPEWGECLTDYLERELCDVARSCKKLGCGALNEPVFRPSPPPPPSPAAPPSAPACLALSPREPLYITVESGGQFLSLIHI